MVEEIYQPHVWRFTSDAVVKYMEPDKVHKTHTMGIVSSQTSIAVPKVWRVVCGKLGFWLFTPYIEGGDLESVWPSLLRKLNVAWTIRGHVRLSVSGPTAVSYRHSVSFSNYRTQ